MKLTQAFIFCVLCFGVAATASAQSSNKWTGCSSSFRTDAAEVEASVGATGTICFEFDEGGADTTFRVKSANAAVCWVRDLVTAAGGAAVVDIYSCPSGMAATTSTCGDKLTTFTADDCISVTRGVYLADITTACDSGDDCLLSVRGY